MLVVGFGSIGKRHLRIVREMLPKAEIAVLRHEDYSIVPKGANYICSTIDEAISFTPNLAVIASPSSFHLATAMPLANAGVHLLIEKPLSATSVRVSDLIETCRKKDLKLAVGYNLRFLKSLKKFKSLVEDQVVGEIWSVRSEVGQYLPAWRPGSDYRECVSAQSRLGGGVLLELSHEIDYLRWIFGDLDWVQATLSKQSDLEIDVEDTAHLLLGFKAKCDAKQLIASVNFDFIRQDSTRVCVIIGKIGSMRWNAISGTIEFWALGSNGWKEIYRDNSTIDESYVAEWKDFISCIRKNSSPLITGTDGLKVLQVVEAARIASKNKSQAKIENFTG